MTTPSAARGSAPAAEAPARFWVETLGCPKNAVDSDKVTASLEADGLTAAESPAEADVVVVNTCAFIEAARRESVDAVLALADARKDGARLVVTGCLAERYGEELAAALPEVDAVVGFAREGSIADVVLKRPPSGVRDLLELPRPAPRAPWAYVKVAEGCDRTCAFCAIPSFRGKQRSRPPGLVEAEVRGLVEGGAREIVLVAQDLASYGRDAGEPGALATLLRRLDRLSADGLARLRLLYLYPSQVRDPLVDTILELPTAVPYFDLSLQHASEPLLRRMRRWGSGHRFLAMIDSIRRREPAAAFRSSFIIGFPGETEDDHDELLDFLGAAELDWAGFFPFCPEDGTPAASMDGAVAGELAAERLREASEAQDRITQATRDALVGMRVEVLVDGREGGDLIGRTYREAPEIDGVVRVEADRLGTGGRRGRGLDPSGGPGAPGSLVDVEVTGAVGPDLLGRMVGSGAGNPPLRAWAPSAPLAAEAGW